MIVEESEEESHPALEELTTQRERTPLGTQLKQTKPRRESLCPAQSRSRQPETKHCYRTPLIASVFFAALQFCLRGDHLHHNNARVRGGGCGKEGAGQRGTQR